MRTAEQGQAAAPRERGGRRRGRGLPGSPAWAVGEHPTDCHKFVERYQFAALFEGRGLSLPGASKGSACFFVRGRYFGTKRAGNRRGVTRIQRRENP